MQKHQHFYVSALARYISYNELSNSIFFFQFFIWIFSELSAAKYAFEVRKISKLFFLRNVQPPVLF